MYQPLFESQLWISLSIKNTRGTGQFDQNFAAPPKKKYFEVRADACCWPFSESPIFWPRISVSVDVDADADVDVAGKVAVAFSSSEVEVRRFSGPVTSGLEKLPPIVNLKQGDQWAWVEVAQWL